MKLAQRMLTASAVLLFGSLMYACGGGATAGGTLTQADFDKLLGTSSAFTDVQTGVTGLKGSMSKMTLIGKVHGQTSMDVGAAIAPDFGPCSDMGVLLGRGDSPNSQDPLSSIYESFQQCTGYEYSVIVATNTVAVGPRLFWDGPNCTGNMYEWNSGGGSYNDQTLEGGVVFLSPADNSSLMVASGQTPSPVLIQSAWVIANPGCQSDVETQNLYKVTQNDPGVTGIPMMSIGKFQLVAP